MAKGGMFHPRYPKRVNELRLMFQGMFKEILSKIRRNYVHPDSRKGTSGKYQEWLKV
jgi:hypothetical protein